MEYATLNMDTYKVVQLLQGKGYTKEEAEGFIEAIQEITLSGVATKQDITDLRSELKQDITDLRIELKQDISDIKIDMLKFQIVQTITLVGVMIALFQIF